MAAIDKLYLNNYNDIENLRKWAFIYYPRLLLYFYSDALTIDEKSFTVYKNNYAKRMHDMFHKQWDKMSCDGTVNAAIAYCKGHWDMDEEEATWQANEAYKDYKKSLQELRGDANIAVMNTPFQVDKKLKWICPLSCIRKYLQNQCGVKEHWYYKLFWKGKKYFKYD